MRIAVGRCAGRDRSRQQHRLGAQPRDPETHFPCVAEIALEQPCAMRAEDDHPPVQPSILPGQKPAHRNRLISGGPAAKGQALDQDFAFRGLITTAVGNRCNCGHCEGEGEDHGAHSNWKVRRGNCDARP